MRYALATIACLASTSLAASASATNYSIEFTDEQGTQLLAGVIAVDSTVNALPDINAGLFGRTITAISGMYKGSAIALVSNPDAPYSFEQGNYIFDNQLVEGSGIKLTSYGLVFTYGGGAANLLSGVGDDDDYGIIDGRSFFLGSLRVTEIATAVPETSTWSMMLLGFGLLGAATRYRRRSLKAAYA